MLQRAVNTTITPIVTQKRPRQVLAITGKALTMGRWTKQQRARMAAHWLLGALIFKPSLVIAAVVFGVSVPLIKAAVRELEATTIARRRSGRCGPTRRTPSATTSLISTCANCGNASTASLRLHKHHQLTAPLIPGGVALIITERMQDNDNL